MRLFLLPISTRRTLIYCERAQSTTPDKSRPISERIIDRAATTWATWEKAEKGWQKKLTEYGNQLFKRIPYEEWGLKSIPPATKQRLKDINDGSLKFECHFPSRFLHSGKVGSVIEQLAVERQSLHKRRMYSCIAWMPITIPFTIVPVIPNIPFFYLCFRAYSHYRALYGGRLLEQLSKGKFISEKPSSVMDEIYTSGLVHQSEEKVRQALSPSQAQIDDVVRDIERQSQGSQESEMMLLQKWNGKLLAEGFNLPELEIEIERAVEQVEKSIQETQEKAKEKSKHE